ncbi:MAG: peptidoglycan D,D-transpeptidase FtsI family protein [Alphaproteobacteria bacterium]
MIIKSKNFKIFDSDALKKFHKRIFFSIVVFICCYFLAIFRIADVMILEINLNKNQKFSLISERGKIYDRNGQLLSTTINSHSLFVNTLKIKKDKKILAKRISSIININNEEIYKKLISNKKFVYLKRNISPKEHQKIIELGEINLQTLIEKKRIYPFRNIGSHILGYVDVDNNGLAGIEKSYDENLKNGEDLYLTLDINLQNAATNELLKTINKFSAESGSIIIMDIENSEILSLVNYPDFDSNNINQSNSNQRLNRALQSNYEMGSTFKPITVAMGIDSGIIDHSMTFDVSKPIKNKIEDWDPCNCSLSVKEIVVRSSNIGTAKIAEKIGKDNQIDFFKKIGFYEPINIKLNEAAKPFGQPYHWGKMETMTIGYGHGFAITPLHLAVAYSGILNDGIKTDPKIIIEDKIKNYKKIINKETSNYISYLLRSVIQETQITGPKVRIEGYDIGGKTGTAELINGDDDYDKDLNRTIFVSAFPMSEPKYLILSFIDKPKRKKENNYSITSATVNAPLVKGILIKIIEILQLPKIDNKQILNAATSIKYKQINAIN